MPLEISLTSEQEVPLRASPLTASGRAAPLDGPLRATVISGTGTARAGEDDLEVVLVSSDQPGDTTYLIEGDADLGAGVALLHDTVTVHVSAALAETMGLGVGRPRPRA